MSVLVAQFVTSMTCLGVFPSRQYHTEYLIYFFPISSLLHAKGTYSAQVRSNAVSTYSKSGGFISIKTIVTLSTQKVTGSEGLSWTVSHITGNARIQTVTFSTHSCILFPSTSQTVLKFYHLKEDPNQLESILHINKILLKEKKYIKQCLTQLNFTNPILKK